MTIIYSPERIPLPTSTDRRAFLTLADHLPNCPIDRVRVSHNVVRIVRQTGTFARPFLWGESVAFSSPDVARRVAAAFRSVRSGRTV